MKTFESARSSGWGSGYARLSVDGSKTKIRSRKVERPGMDAAHCCLSGLTAFENKFCMNLAKQMLSFWQTKFCNDLLLMCRPSRYVEQGRLTCELVPNRTHGGWTVSSGFSMSARYPKVHTQTFNGRTICKGVCVYKSRRGTRWPISRIDSSG